MGIQVSNIFLSIQNQHKSPWVEHQQVQTDQVTLRHKRRSSNYFETSEIHARALLAHFMKVS